MQGEQPGGQPGEPGGATPWTWERVVELLAREAAKAVGQDPDATLLMGRPSPGEPYTVEMLHLPAWRSHEDEAKRFVAMYRALCEAAWPPVVYEVVSPRPEEAGTDRMEEMVAAMGGDWGGLIRRLRDRPLLGGPPIP